jgi:hypothetical protein
MNFIDATINIELGEIFVKENYKEDKPIDDYSTIELANLYCSFKGIISGKRFFKENFSKEKKIVDYFKIVIKERLKFLPEEEKLIICKAAGIY